MKLADLRDQSVFILGLGVEGQSTWRFLRAAFPEKTLGLADRLPLEKLSAEVRQRIEADSRLRLHFGDGYLSGMGSYDVIVKSPGISVKLPEYRQALAAGKQITSQTALFFASAPGTIIGVTGTKGKSTTASLIYSILKRAFPNTQLVGNIGVPPLDLLADAAPDARFVYELSSHQLEGLRQSPPIAVLLNIVPEHLDYYESFEQYVEAKENITRFQTERDFLIYDSDRDLPTQIAFRSRAQRVACSLAGPRTPGCFLWGDSIVYRSPSGEEEKMVDVSEVPLRGRFNLMNVAAAIAAAKGAGASSSFVADGVREFRPLEHRLECAGSYGGITYYDDSIATVPEATIAALDTLGNDVETVLLGGADRGLDFSQLAARLMESGVKTLIFFPPSGRRIWQAVSEKAADRSKPPQHFFVETMEEAMEVVRRHTGKGKICLLSPASPSFGLFRDYRERGEAFKRLAREAEKRPPR